MFSTTKKIKRSLSFFLSISVASSCYSAVIGISQIIDHPALNITRRGIEDAIHKQPDTQIIFENAQGNITTSSLIAQKFVGQKVDVIVAIGTPSAQAALNAVKGTTIPVVFATITDPQGAHLLKNLQEPEGQITGSSNFTNIQPQIDLFKKLTPQLKKLGMIYNPSEVNGTIMVEKTRAAVAKDGIEVIAVTASNTREVADAARNLVGKVDAYFISNDSTALSAFEAIVKAATDANLPVYVSDVDIVARGAIAALGPNQYYVGASAGETVLKLLNGQTVKDTPVTFPTDNELYINLTQAEKIGMKIPAELSEKAVKKL